MFNDFLDVLADDTFDEIPVPLKTFVESPDYMNQPPLSPIQLELLEAMTQILTDESLDNVYSDRPDYCRYLKSLKIREVIAMLGKGAGKNHTTTLAVARVVYLLLCMKDPAQYFGKPPGNDIAILNIAVNSEQAKNTFFIPLKKLIDNSPWFRGKYDAGRSGIIKFDKNVTAYSGHSQREAWEGYNVLFVVLDEIAAYKTQSESTGASHRADTAPAIYDMYRASITSRFPGVGKLCLLSFPRFKGDFITQRFNEVAGEIERVDYSADYAVMPDQPMSEKNKFTISWYEEKILTYNEPYIYAIRAPSWRVNPLRKLEEYVPDFVRNEVDALTRFACNPPDSIDAFFTDQQKVEESFKDVRHPFLDNWQFMPNFVGDSSVRYYMHVDLAQKSDRAAISIAHVEDWVKVGSGSYQSIEPVVKIDAVRWWTPTPGKNVDFTDVKNFINAVKRRGFNLSKVTFDRWAGSAGLQNELAREGIEVETLSVGRGEYNDFQLTVYDGRLRGYHLPLLVDEIFGLRVDGKGRIDHTASGSNDLADAVAGSVHLCLKYESRPDSGEVDIQFLGDDEDDDGVASLFKRNVKPLDEKPAPPRGPSMPVEVEMYLREQNII